MRTLSRLASAVIAAGLAGPALAGPALAGPVAAARAVGAVGSTECIISGPGDDATSTEVSESDDEDNPALRALRLDDVHQLSTGQGIGVAVIDSGVQPSPDLSAVEGTSYVGSGPIVNAHGTIVAGLIAGRGDVTGMAPDADIVSIRVSASEPDDDDPQPASVNPDHVAAAIQWAVTHRKEHNIRVINLSLGFPEKVPAITRAVEAAEKAEIVVVAAAGNRPPESYEVADAAESEKDADKPDPTPDEVLFPATLDEVLAVTGRAPDLSMTTDAVLAGPEIDVSAPVVGLRSVMLKGLVCDIPDTASSWAAAEVSGLAALILQRDQSLSAAQVRTRIEMTAQGGFRDSATDGHGMIQPHDALTAILDIAADGSPHAGGKSGRAAYQAPPPDPQEDSYASSRSRMLWWGVGAGGAVLLVLMLRPLTARSRRD